MSVYREHPAAESSWRIPSVKLLDPSFTVFIHCKTRHPRTLVGRSVGVSLYPRFLGTKDGGAHCWWVTYEQSFLRQRRLKSDKGGLKHLGISRYRRQGINRLLNHPSLSVPYTTILGSLRLQRLAKTLRDLARDFLMGGSHSQTDFAKESRTTHQASS